MARKIIIFGGLCRGRTWQELGMFDVLPDGRIGIRKSCAHDGEEFKARRSV